MIVLGYFGEFKGYFRALKSYHVYTQGAKGLNIIVLAIRVSGHLLDTQTLKNHLSGQLVHPNFIVSKF